MQRETALKIPYLTSTRRTIPKYEISLRLLDWVLSCSPHLLQLTQNVRTAEDPGAAKLWLPGVCLSGTFMPLPPDADHGQANPRVHSNLNCGGTLGYRNGQHVAWQQRTGLLLVDVDDIAAPASTGAVKTLLHHTAGSVVLSWTSARGAGLKLAVAVTPIPMTRRDHLPAWRAARDYVASVLDPAGLVEGTHFKIDPTYAPSQLAILAHDDNPLIRRGISEAVPWTPGQEPDRLYQPAVSLAQAATVNGLAEQLDWQQGTRSHSLYKLGAAAALQGFEFEAARVDATTVAQRTGLIRDYGLATALRHHDRGFFWGRDQLLDFGWNPTP